MVAKKSVVFKNAIIDTAEGTITEITDAVRARERSRMNKDAAVARTGRLFYFLNIHD